MNEAARGTVMAREAAEAPAAVARMLEANRAVLADAGERLRASPPAVVVTCARGSSDHAATYAKYLIETLTGVPVASAAPSVASLYRVQPTTGPRLCLAISQSGQSPDLLAAVEHQRGAGAFVVALVNAEDTPLHCHADAVIALSAGPERAVAATKSYICSLAAIAALAAEWSQDAELREAVAALPGLLEQASSLDWSPAVSLLREASSAFVIGRGLGLGIAQEAALKLKETSALHAEAFSAAEVRHGPMALVGENYPVLALGGGTAGASVREVAAEFRTRGAKVLLADPESPDSDLPALAAHSAIEPILAIQSFYPMASDLALARGLNPDAPPHLRKVTQTL
jgi:glucosamine--fructose-6-phosphate aminotransferase (isomerizing)